MIPPPTTTRVWKYELKDRVTRLQLPFGTEALSVTFQGDSLFLYAALPKDLPTVYDIDRHFLRVWTGEAFAEPQVNKGYIGLATDQAFQVWHVFEVKP